MELQDNLRVTGLAAAFMGVVMALFILVAVFMYREIDAYKENAIALAKMRRRAAKKSRRGFSEEASRAKATHQVQRRQRAQIRASQAGTVQSRR